MPDYNPDSMDAVVARIEQKVDNLGADARRWREEHEERIADLRATVDSRITELRSAVDSHERFKYWVLGIAAATGAAGGKLLSFITGSGGPKT